MGYARTLADGQRCRILVHDLVTGASTVVHESSKVLFEAPNWTVDDQLVVNGDGLLWTLPADGSAPPRQIPIDVPELNNDHVLAPVGDGIYLSAEDGHIYAASLRGGPARKVTDDDGMLHYLHGVSPAGAMLAYVGIERGRWDDAAIWTVLVSGGAGTRLTVGPGPDDGPEFSPDGAWIYFNTERFSETPGHAQIARMRFDGAGMEQLTFDERVNWFPHLSPDGLRAVYLSFPPGTLGHPADLPVELKLVEGGDWRAARTIVSLPGGQGTINVNSWSTDGTRFAYIDYPSAGH